jgi:hypothetical protein
MYWTPRLTISPRARRSTHQIVHVYHKNQPITHIRSSIDRLFLANQHRRGYERQYGH